MLFIDRKRQKSKQQEFATHLHRATYHSSKTNARYTDDEWQSGTRMNISEENYEEREQIF